MDWSHQISSELQLNRSAVLGVLHLLGEGNTIPFIARYRKEKTGNLDEVQLRAIQERNQYLCDLEERRQTILKSIESQGKLTEELKESIQSCDSKSVLEDLYLPYKPKRRTRAMIARERGLEPLAEMIWERGTEGKESDAASYIDEEKGVPSLEAAWSGARDIVAERVSEIAELRRLLREAYQTLGVVVSKGTKEKEGEKTKYDQYKSFSERVATIPSHRYLAIRRGDKEGYLDFSIELEGEGCVQEALKFLGYQRGSFLSDQLETAVRDAYRRLMMPSVETDIRVDLKVKADEGAVDIFADNLRKLLLASPLGEKAVIGVDPGLRTGCKCVALDATGKYLEAVTVFLCRGDLAGEKAKFLKFLQKYPSSAIGVGNGTGGREAEALFREWVGKGLKDQPLVVQVNESGASVYSASDVAREEFPDLDLTLRGAISIARRLQDPLAELVKIDPKSIGVGQYQHDVYQPLLQGKLEAVVESCVNHVGVELNTASTSLLSFVAGIGSSVAKKIVDYRNTAGAFSSRQELLNVPGVGKRTFEQAAGFLRVRNGKHPLDASAVHPERYGLVEQMAKDAGASLEALVGKSNLLKALDLKQYESKEVGLITLKDILSELEKPGRDPREHFQPPRFREDVHSPKDLTIGMQLEGIVTNVAAFGAFVDIGVHQDGLIHVSQLSDRFIKDPKEVVSVGDRIQVTVLEVDLERNRISLSALKRGGTSREKKNRAPARDTAKKSFSQSAFSGL